MYSAIHKGRSQTEGERKRERERWIRDPCGHCTDINESPGYYCGQFLIQSDRRLAECSGFPLESEQYITDLQRLLAFTAPVTHQPEDTHKHTHHEECTVYTPVHSVRVYRRVLNASGVQSVKTSLLKSHSAFQTVYSDSFVSSPSPYMVQIHSLQTKFSPVLLMHQGGATHY